MNVPGVAVGLSLLLCMAPAQVEDPKIEVSVDGAVFAPGSEITVNVALLPTTGPLGPNPGRLPDGYLEPTAFYQACTALDETDTWYTGLGAEVFCALAGQQTKIGQSPAEPVVDIAEASSARHTFTQKLTLPKHPIGTKLWIIVRLNYGLPNLPTGLHKSLYASAELYYRCEQPGGDGVSTLVTCSYYTPGGWVIRQVGRKVRPVPAPPPGT